MSNGLQNTKNALADSLFQLPHRRLVTGVAIGLHAAEDSQGDILIFVEPAASCELEKLRKEIQAILPDIEKKYNITPSLRFIRSGQFRGQSITGASISYQVPRSLSNLPPESAGTFGAVADIRGQKYLLGSNHVLSHNGRVSASPQAKIVSPGRLDGGGKPIAVPSYYVELKPVDWPPQTRTPRSHADAALCKMTDLQVANSARTQISPFSGTPTTPLPVMKRGRTTRQTFSVLCITDWEGYIDLDFGSFYFEGLLGVVGNEQPQTPTCSSPFAAPGDSGALVRTHDTNDQAIGLVTARAYGIEWGGKPISGAPSYDGYNVLVCPIETVRKELATTQELMRDFPGIQPGEIKLFVDQ